MLKNLKNKEKAIILEEIKTINGFTIPTGTKVKMINCLNVTAILDILPHFECKYTKFPLYYRVVIKSENMFVPIKRRK
jgi:hypothetical protein